jgi:hypothetical protein
VFGPGLTLTKFRHEPERPAEMRSDEPNHQTAVGLSRYDRPLPPQAATARHSNRIGHGVRMLLLPTEPPPHGILELLQALDKGEPEKERIEKIPSYVVRDFNGQALVYFYCGANETEALQANVLTEDEARRLAISIARLRRGD